MGDRQRCSFCAQPAAYGPFGAVAVCEACAKTIGAVARDSDGVTLDEIWSSSADVEASHGAGDSEERLAAFKQTVAERISGEDADSHANLAEAYRAMGLYQDAVREAATALSFAREARTIGYAVEMLLSPPLLTTSGFGPLRSRVMARRQ